MKNAWVLLVALLLSVSARAAEPPIAIELGPRHGHATPQRQGYTHTAAGNTFVVQPGPDILVVTMTGVAVASGHPFKDSSAAMDFDLNQEFKVAINDAKLKKGKLIMEARVIGLLRAEGGSFGQTVSPTRDKHCGGAEQGQACAAVTAGGLAVASLCVEPHSVGCGESLSLNCQEGPIHAPIVAGCYTLHQVFHVSANVPRSVLPCRPSSAEFAPDPALDPVWISYRESFHGAAKKDFGFQVTIRVVPD